MRTVTYAVPFFIALKLPVQFVFVILTTELLLVRKVRLAAAEPFGTAESTVNFSPTPIVTVPFDIVTLEGAFLTVILHDFSFKYSF